MPKDSDYLLKPFFEGTSSVLVSLLLFCLAACFGQLLFAFSDPEVWGSLNHTNRLYYVEEAVFGAPFTFPLAGLSGVGLVFVVMDAFCFYQLVHSDRSRLTILFTIAANQIGMIYSYWLIFERDYPWRFHGQILASLGILLGLFWLTRKVITSIPRST